MLTGKFLVPFSTNGNSKPHHHPQTHVSSSSSHFISRHMFTGLAWLVIPSGIGYYSSGFVYNSWRVFLMICALPSFTVAILLYFLPESPKFLLAHGQEEEAMAVFRKIYAMNTNKNPEDYPVSGFRQTFHFQ